MKQQIHGSEPPGSYNGHMISAHALDYKVLFHTTNKLKNVRFTWKRTCCLFLTINKLKNANSSFKKVWMLISG